MSGTEKIPVFVLYAPTAAGKTALAEQLFASDADSPYAGKAEIISADSMQVYKGMNIGTAKPDAAFLERLPHHLVDIVEPDYNWGTAEFVQKADVLCRAIWEKGKLPVVLGGTAFYIQNFLYGLPKAPEADEEVRAHLLKRAKKEGTEALHKELEACDPESAAKIHVHDEYRIVRALEVFISTGKKRSDYSCEHELRPDFHFIPVHLTRPREELFSRINARVEDMFRQGLADEVHELIKEGFCETDSGMRAIGYREFFQMREKAGGFFFDSGKWLGAVKEMIKTDTRKYAKKQENFFSIFPHGIDVLASNALDEALDLLDNDCKFH
ncbi:MAG: tRNA (adenosine(37)-N6)-dimethylallyltransferase MiaA [Treponema sp.]|nr:tRNA (adenosine(37)-N6)-dimethylallyltransferase MiaA [Candidatus Treponema caballi]